MDRRILLVANQTLGGDRLTATVHDRVAAGATELWILAPATTSTDPLGSSAIVAGVARVSPERSGVEMAEARLRDALYRFDGIGIPVGGEVSDKDPLSAVSDVLSKRPFEEVIISTLPTSISHWLRIDLPSRVHRKFRIPVTTVTARSR
jgi:hypothetical protein